MKIETGYIYHIKDEFFDRINDKGLMINHDKIKEQMLEEAKEKKNENN